MLRLSVKTEAASALPQAACECSFIPWLSIKGKKECKNDSSNEGMIDSEDSFEGLIAQRSSTASGKYNCIPNTKTNINTSTKTSTNTKTNTKTNTLYYYSYIWR